MSVRQPPPAGVVEVWRLDLAAAGAPAGDEALLDDEERARAGRLVREADRRLFVAAHAFVRDTLSRYADVPAHAWRFSTGERGRPEIAEPARESGLRFNLSHTRGRVLCAVTRDADVGVDVEKLSRVDEPHRLARRYFAPSEVDALLGLPEMRRRERFFQLWTLKEAYIKARGLGLAIPLDRFWFERPDVAPVRVSRDASLGDTRDWDFELLESGPVYAEAVCVERRGAAAVRVVRHEAGP